MDFIDNLINQPPSLLPALVKSAGFADLHNPNVREKANSRDHTAPSRLHLLVSPQSDHPIPFTNPK